MKKRYLNMQTVPKCLTGSCHSGRYLAGAQIISLADGSSEKKRYGQMPILRYTLAKDMCELDSGTRRHKLFGFSFSFRRWENLY